MTEEKLTKLTFLVNTVILIMVFGLMAFFWLIDVPFLVLFSVPTSFIYLIGYYLIHKGKLDLYVWMVYFWLTFYMGVTTVCLGYSFGFHLYCMSMIPVLYVTEYLSMKLKKDSLKALPVSLAVVIFDLICTGYVSYFGPVYERDRKEAGIFWLMNSVFVFGFLIFYTDYMTKQVVQSEKKLMQQAHIDNLTGLYNRHFMVDVLGHTDTSEKEYILAMADIDHFKNINDTYGHNAGDYVLKRFSQMLKDVCHDATIGRWGGEEFLVLVAKESADEDYFERLRKELEKTVFESEGVQINVTVTVGVTDSIPGESMDDWVHRTDENLYYGKNHGRNTVVRK